MRRRQVPPRDRTAGAQRGGESSTARNLRNGDALQTQAHRRFNLGTKTNQVQAGQQT
jgi:hypothetical protein